MNAAQSTVLLSLAAHSLTTVSGESRKLVGPGQTHIKGTLKIDALVKIGSDHEVAQVNKVDPWSLLLLALDRLPKGAIDDIMRQAAVNVGIISVEDEARLKVIKARTSELLRDLKEISTIIRKGAVKVEGDLSQKITGCTVIVGEGESA